ncbi:MAG: Asp23/Gls24 family envelope stress response protein [Faecalibacterium sp.]
MEDRRMDLQNMDLKGGSLQISTEVIGKIARCAALEIEGVAEVSCGRQNKKVKDLLEIASLQSPVTVTMREGTAEITLNLLVNFGVRIPSVAEKVQENVKSAVQSMTNVTVSRVDLVIAGLSAPQEDPAAE